MRKFFRFPLYLAMGVLLAASAMACSDDNDDDGSDAVREAGLKAAVSPYVNNTVIGTYTKMADASIELYEKCVAIKNAFNQNTLTSTMIVDAGKSWNNARQYWELSEAFLFGPAGDSGAGIDGHIDTWPVAKVTVTAILNNADLMKAIQEKGAAGLPAEEGVLGFHATEALLFQLDATETKSEPHSVQYTSNELIYLVAIAEDLMNQCVLLEAYWAGSDKITVAKQTILNNAGLTFKSGLANYGSRMVNPGVNDQTYKNYLGVAQDIIQGCIDIADEVGNQKIGRPVNGSSEDDKNYIESPYSLNSIVDFTDNIISIKNSYEGINSGDASISDYIKSVDPTLDAKVKASIQAAIDIIGKIPEPFAKNASTNADAKEAVTVVGTDLVKTLEEVAQALSKY